MPYTHTILITGGTTGLGYHAALNLAQHHPNHLIVIASRTDKHSAASTINKTLNQTNTIYLPLDLSSLSKVRDFEKAWEEKAYPPIQLLLLNAGLQFPGSVEKTDDGIEKTFGVNHVGHALLFHLLYPYLSDTARIVVTSSGTHDPAQNSGLPDAKYTTAEELAHPTPQSSKNTGRQRYATSKLVNVMWTYALQRRFDKLGGKNLAVAAFDPGLMPGTGLARDASAVERFLWMRVLPKVMPVLRVLYTKNIHLPEVSGGNLAWVAAEAEVEDMRGGYFEGKKKIESSRESHDVGKQEELWKWTVENVAVTAEERARFDI